MTRWRDLSTEARNTVLDAEVSDLAIFWAALVITVVVAAIWKWSGA